MRTVAILLLAAVNMALLATVSLELLLPQTSAPAIAAMGAESGKPDSEKAAALVKAEPAAKADAPILYVKRAVPVAEMVDPQTGMGGTAADISDAADGKTVADGKDIVDAKDAKDLAPVAELLPGESRVLSGTPDPNSEFDPNALQGSSGSSSGQSSGILTPARVINIVPPTVSQETP